MILLVKVVQEQGRTLIIKLLGNNNLEIQDLTIQFELNFLFFKQNILPLVLKKVHQLQHYAFHRDCATIEANLYGNSSTHHKI